MNLPTHLRIRETRKPVLYEINTRVWLRELGTAHGRALNLAEVPEAEIDRLAALGCDLVWLMGVWCIGERAVRIAREHAGLREEYRRALPDVSPEDIAGSPYSVAEYSVSPALGGSAALASLRERLARRGIGLILDYVSNHTGVDHHWVRDCPDFFVPGDAEALRREPENYFVAETARGRPILAHGRDPYFPGWTDTAQIDFLQRPARAACIRTIEEIADQCDGIRCDMAMLVLDEIFRRTWGDRARPSASGPLAAGEFWTEAIEAVRIRRPRFLFIAEAYWELEWRLQRLGFDFTYDKRLYDRLRHGDGASVRAHLGAEMDFQTRCVRFLENHDEPRAAAVFPPARHRAAAVAASTLPGMLLVHDGQVDGLRIRLPVQLSRRAREPGDGALQKFYRALLSALQDPAVRRGAWRSLGIRAAWDGNPTASSFLAHAWEAPGLDAMLVAVNYSETGGQCYADFSRPEFAGRSVELVDLLGEARYTRSGADLLQKGLYLDLPAYGFHLFRVALRAP